MESNNISSWSEVVEQRCISVRVVWRVDYIEGHTEDIYLFCPLLLSLLLMTILHSALLALLARVNWARQKMLVRSQVLRVVFWQLIARPCAHELIVLRVVTRCQKCLAWGERHTATVGVEASVARIAAVEVWWVRILVARASIRFLLRTSSWAYYSIPLAQSSFNAPKVIVVLIQSWPRGLHPISKVRVCLGVSLLH